MPSPGWWNGRHEGLRSLCRKVCRFESCPGHSFVLFGPTGEMPRAGGGRIRIGCSWTFSSGTSESPSPPRPSRTQHHRIFRRANGDLPGGQFQTQGDRNHGCADPRKKPQAVVKRSFTTVVAMLSFNACQWNSQPITGKLAMILRSSCGALLAAIKPSPISRLADLPATRVPLAFSPPTRLR